MADAFEDYVKKRRQQLLSGQNNKSDQFGSYTGNRRNELLQSAGAFPAPSSISTQPVQTVQTDDLSDPFVQHVQNRQMDLGLIEDTRPLSQRPIGDIRAAMPKEFQNVNILAGSPLLQPKPVEIPNTLKNVNPIASSDLYKSGQGDPVAIQNSQIRANSIPQDVINRNRREMMQPRNGFEAALKSVADPVANVIDAAMYQNPAGKFLTRTGHAAASMTGPTAANKPDTGSKVANIAADIVGSVAGFATNPATGNSPGTSLMTGPYKQADALLNTNIGQKAVQGVANQIGRVASPALANNLASNLIRGGVAGGAQNVLQSAMRNETDADQLAKSAAIGVGLGAAGDTVLGALGYGTRAAINASRSNKVGQELLRSVEKTTLPTPTPSGRLVANQDSAWVKELDEYVTKLKQGTEPTRARVETRTNTNPYRQQFESLIEEAKATPMRAGYEYEGLKELWSQRAGREAPGLDELVELAYPSQKTRKITSDFIQKAKENQRLRNVYGVGMPVKDNAGVPEMFKGETKQTVGNATSDQLIKPSSTITQPPVIKSSPDITQPPTVRQAAKATSDIPDFLRISRKNQVDSIKPDVSAPPVPNRTLNEQIAASLEELSQPVGIASLGKSSPYERAALTDTMSQITSRSKPDASVSLGTKANRAYQNMVDDVHSFNRFDKFAEKVLGRELNAAESTHKTALSTRGSDMIANQIITQNMVDKNGQIIGASLKERLAALPLNRYAEFEDYLLNKHAMTRFDRGETVFDDRIGWNPEMGQQKITKYEAEYPVFKEIADQVYDYQRTMVEEWLVKTGMISQEQANAWFEANPFYVPNKRHFTEMEKGARGNGAKKGFGDQSVPVKKYGKTGSQRKIISPLETIIENTDAFVKTAKRNDVMQKFVGKVAESPEEFKDWAEIVKSPTDNRLVSSILDGPDSVIDEMSLDFDKKVRKTNLDKDNIVRVLVNGEPVHVQIKDQDLLNSVMAIGPEGASVLDIVGKLTNMFKTFTTGVNPYFAVRNVTRDLGDAWVNSKSTNNPITFLNDYLRSSFEIIKVRKGELWQQYKNVGGGHTSPVAAPNMLARSKAAVLPETVGKKLTNLPKKSWRLLEDVLSATESMARLSEFKRWQGSKTPDELAKALYEAQEVAVNFSRRGTVTKQIDKVFPYFNAAIQGLDKFVRTFKDNPVKASVKATMALTVPTAVLYAMNRDNPEYQELPDYVKDNYFLIPDGNGKFIRIAKPREIGTIFSDIPERLMRQFADEDPEAWKEFSEQLIKTFTIPGIEGAASTEGGVIQRAGGLLRNSILSPIVDVAMNENFAGSPIVPQYLQKRESQYQYDEKTSDFARKLGELGLGSPKELDYVMQQYGGGLAKALLSGNNPSSNITSGLASQFVVDPVYSNKVSNDFYDYKDKIDSANNNKDMKEPPEWYSDSLRKKFNKLSDKMSDTRKAIREIEKDQSLSRNQKEEKLRELRATINDLARQGNTLAKERNVK